MQRLAHPQAQQVAGCLVRLSFGQHRRDIHLKTEHLRAQKDALVGIIHGDRFGEQPRERLRHRFLGGSAEIQPAHAHPRRHRPPRLPIAQVRGREQHPGDDEKGQEDEK